METVALSIKSFHFFLDINVNAKSLPRLGFEPTTVRTWGAQRWDKQATADPQLNTVYD